MITEWEQPQQGVSEYVMVTDDGRVFTVAKVGKWWCLTDTRGEEFYGYTMSACKREAHRRALEVSA